MMQGRQFFCLLAILCALVSPGGTAVARPLLWPGVNLFRGQESKPTPLQESYLLHAEDEPATTPGNPLPRRYEILLESRASIKKEFVRPGASRRNRSRPLASLHAEWKPLAIWAGHRFLPGPRSSYLEDPQAISLLPGLPSGRERAIHLIQLLPDEWSGGPGAFAIQGKGGPGLFYAIHRQLFAAYHPVDRSAALATNVNGQDWSTAIDLVHRRDDTQGYSRFSYGGASSPGRIRLEAERRPGWDEAGESHREGKSGHASGSGDLHDAVFWDAIGEDRGMHLFRLLRADIRVPLEAILSVIPGRLILGAAIRDYRPLAAPADATHHGDGKGGVLGYDFDWSAGGLKLEAESWHGAASVYRMGVYQEWSGYRFTLAASYASEIGWPLVLSREASHETDNRIYYLPRAAMHVRVRGEHLAIVLDVRFDDRGRSSGYAALQTRALVF